jgi:hypothetical protein
MSSESCLFADGAVRKVFPALAVFSELLGPSPNFVADMTGGCGFIFAFETGTQATLILWDPDEKANVAIPTDVPCEDIMGQVVTDPTVSLTGSPVYMIGPPGQAKKIFTTCAAMLQSEGGSTPSCKTPMLDLHKNCQFETRYEWLRPGAVAALRRVGQELVRRGAGPVCPGHGAYRQGP